MNQFQISETVNTGMSINNSSNNSETMIFLSKSTNNNINTKIIPEKPPHDTLLSNKGNVKSYCRIRPNHTLYSSLDKFKLENNNRTLIVDFTSDQDKNNPSKQYIYKYNFTEIFWTLANNQEIYEKVCSQSIKELFSMHKNALIFVYGITNSGKTYTVSGNMTNPGILQLSLISLFKEFKKLKENNNCWQLSCTYIEIYNEEVFDLLSKERKKIKIVGGGNKFYAQGCIIKNIDSVQDFTDTLNTGEYNRTKAETNANPYSSRSHSIFRVELSYNDKDGFNFIEPVSLCIVDLAGAERVSKSGVIGTNLKEAGNINSSLLVLKKCFDAMETNSRTNVVDKKLIVPVRESKLTMLFKEYFASHQNISVICTINPDRNEMMDIRSVLNFGAKAMKVKPVKSWIPTYNYSSREVSPNKTENRGNSPLVKDNRKKYRLLTEKKYLEKKFNNHNNNINNHIQKSSSKENISKVREDNYSGKRDYFSSKKKNEITSVEKMQNIKLIKYKNNNNDNHVLTLHNEKTEENSDNNNNNERIPQLIYQERIKCHTNPFELVASKTNYFFMKNSKSKEQIRLEKAKKEKKAEEIKEKLSKYKKDITNLIMDIYNKKIYYENCEKNIDIYENQCNNTDLNEVRTILFNNNENDVYSLKNPFIKNYEEDKFLNLSKTRQINLSYLNMMKEKILKNENNINISYNPPQKNEKYEITSNYNIDYIPDKNNNINNNNEYDVFRGNRELIEELQLKLNNSDHDQTKIMEFLDKSFEQYNPTQFKAYFGIGNSLIRKFSEEQNKKINDNNQAKNDIEMADKIDKAENDENINFNFNDAVIDLFSNENNYKGKGKDIKFKNDVIKEESKENKREKEKEKEGSKENKKDKEKEKEDEKEKEEESEIVEKENKRKRNKTKEKKSKKEKSKKKGKKKKKENDSDEDKTSEKEEIIESDKEKEKIKEKSEDSKDSKEEEVSEEKEEKKSRKRRKNVSKEKKNNKKSKSKKRKKQTYEDESIESEEDKKIIKNDDNTSGEEESEKVITKKRKNKIGKTRKKKITSDIDSDDESNEEYENIKPIRKKKGRSKKNNK